MLVGILQHNLLSKQGIKVERLPDRKVAILPLGEGCLELLIKGIRVVLELETMNIAGGGLRVSSGALVCRFCLSSLPRLLGL